MIADNPHTTESFKSALTYDPETGILRWIKRNGRAFVGNIAGLVSQKSKGYACLKFNKKSFKAHRVAWLLQTGSWPTAKIDHINGIRHDNRFCNLREATNSQNAMNSKLRKDNSTGFKGVRNRADKNCFEAYLTVNRKTIYLGQRKTAIEAGQLYAKNAALYHGEFSRLT